MDEQSIGSDDTPATSNVGFDYSRTFDVSLTDDDALAPYSRQPLPHMEELDQPDADDTASQPQYDGIDDRTLSSEFHTRRSTHYRDDDDDDDDLDLQESFAVGDFSAGSITRYTEQVEISLTATPDLEEVDLQSRANDLVEQTSAAPVDDEPQEIIDAAPSDMMAPEPFVLVPVSVSGKLEAANNDVDDQPDEHATSFTNASSPPMSEDVAIRESRTVDVPSVAEMRLAQVEETALNPYAASTSTALVSSGSNDSMVPVDQSLSVASHSATESMLGGRGISDESTLSSIQRNVDEEVSLSPSEVFGARSVMRPQLKAQSTEKHDHDDDESTINTHGDSYWTTQYDPEKGAYPTKPSTIEEGDEEEESSPSLGLENDAASRGSWYQSRESFTSGSHKSPSSGSSRTVGVALRTASSRRRGEFREVEVSMDGFMHQNRQVDDRPMNMPLIGTFVEEKKTKLSRACKYSTLCAVMCLLATVMFFAVNIGPFEVQPDTKKPSSSALSVSVAHESIRPDEMTGSSTNNNVNPSDQKGQPSSRSINSRSNGAGSSWMTTTFMNSKQSYAGKSAEIPIVWAHEKSGGEILPETVSKCLGKKVVAGDGKRYDIQNTNSEHFASNVSTPQCDHLCVGNHLTLNPPRTCQTFKVLNTDRFLYINVDLFSTAGLDRAAAMRLTQSRVSDVIYTPYLWEASAKLFPPQSSSNTNPEVSGRLLVVFRDPIERALNRYEIARVLTGNDALSITEYMNNAVYSENNPLTRDLLGLGPEDGLGKVQIKAAQEIINQYVFVGLFDKLEESIARFASFFHWFVSGDSQSQYTECTRNVLIAFQKGYQIGSNYAVSDPAGYNLLVANYMLDRLIYKYAKAQYILQGKILKENQNKQQYKN